VQTASSPSFTTPSALACRVAADPAELAGHFALRRRVFVIEQRIFQADDRDRHDDDPRTLHVVGMVADEFGGAVRLYPLDRSGALWKGDRLAVLPEHRACHLGARLVRFAVATAGERGGRRMIAHIQLPNVRFFEHLGWRAEGAPAPFQGVEHQLMAIGLGPGDPSPAQPAEPAASGRGR
jgi:putative N-acetyltransferase (TIGR04045 family)